MASWTTYKGLDVPDTTSGDAGTKLKSDLELLADRAPFYSAVDPDVDKDSDHNFIAGSEWFNTTSQVMWICIDDGVGAAKWRSLYKRIENAIVLAPATGITGSDGRSLQFDDEGVARGINAVDLQRTRTNNGQVAMGDNAAILSGENNGAFSIDSVVAGGKGNRAGGGFITGISIGNPSTLTSGGHQLGTGDSIAIRGSNSTPSVDGNHAVTVLDVNNFSISLSSNVTAAGNSGAWSVSAQQASVAGGEVNVSLGVWSHVAGGAANVASGNAAHAEGFTTIAGGDYSHAEGLRTTAGKAAHSEGVGANAGDYSHAEGAYSVASGLVSHAEGFYTTANGNYAHSEGHHSIASGTNSHAEGLYTTASGYEAHAEGISTAAVGSYSHAGGRLSKAHLRGQWARASGGQSNQPGTAQGTISHLFTRTTSNSAVELTLDGDSPDSDNHFTILDGQTLSCFINIVGRKENGSASDNGSFLRQVCIYRKGSTTQLSGSVQNVGTDINPGTWGTGSPANPIAITADDSNEALVITVTGPADTNVRWTATVFASEAADAQI